MREIKFRGKRIDNGEWVYGSLVQYFGEKHWRPSCEIWLHNDTTEHGSFFVVDPKTVGQSTGLKDKAGIEIYEGDILHYYWKSALSSSQKPIERIFEVVFLDGAYQQLEIYRDNLKYRKDIGIWYEFNDLKVIGNSLSRFTKINSY